MNIEAYAAIDIGSNAVRLLVYHIYPDSKGKPQFKKYALTRVPVRLGDEVFANGVISEAKITQLSHALTAFYHLIAVHNVKAFRACATSAMREAQNAAEVIRKVREASGINIEVIEGSVEADLIFNAYWADNLKSDQAYLYIDVGGGSTEITLFYNGEKLYSESFPVGTVRWLQNKVPPGTMDKIKKTCQELAKIYPKITGIGSGGNIIRLFKMADVREGKSLKRRKLNEIYNLLKGMSYEQRIVELGLNPDRADVIVPASEIFLSVCKKAHIKEIYVPKVGLSDGIIRDLYAKRETHG